MKVKFVGFGGEELERPCYENEQGELFFDENNGRDTLNLYTGAYRHPEDGDICGEPNIMVTENVECDKPFMRHPRELDYSILSRLKSDCEYFLTCCNGYEGYLYHDVNVHCNKMKELYNSFEDNDKPEWITLEQIEEYRVKMLNIKMLNKRK